MKPQYYLFLCVILTNSLSLAQSNAVPFVNQSMAPVSATPGSGGFVLSITGTGFAPTAVLNWNGSPRVTIVNSGSSLQAIITPEDVRRVGTASVTVVNPAPGGGASNVDYFPVRPTATAVGFAALPRFAPGVVTVGDFNNDGIADIAVGKFNSYRLATILIYLGKGNGNFSNPIGTSVPFGISTIVPADINGDGKLDLLVASGFDDDGNNANTIVFLGNGDGSFIQGVELPGSPEAVGDWNGDGALDLVMLQDAGDFGYSNVYVGDGQGGFTLSQYEIGTGYQGSPQGVASVGDFNSDGKLDLAFPGAQLTLGNGDGTFQPPIYVLGSYVGSAIAAADVNNDGKLDLVTNQFSVLLGNGDGTFSNVAGSGVVQAMPIIRLGDFNGDGNLDAMIVSGEFGLSFYLLLGNGDGTFQTPSPFPLGIYDYFTASANTGDFNGDGKLDLLLGGGNKNTMLLLQNSTILSPMSLVFGDQGSGTSSPSQTVTLTNIGIAPLNLGAITFAGQTFSQTNNCGTSVSPSSSCQIAVVFTPTMPGVRAATMSVSFQGLGSPETVSLTGTGVISKASLTPSKLNFPTQLIGTVSTPQTVTLTNTGSLPVTISSIVSTGAFTETNNCPSSLNEAVSCQIQVQFKPTSTGLQGGKLSVTDSALHSPQGVEISGTGTEVKLSATGLNFGDQKVGTSSVAVPVMLTNIGSVPLSVSQISITGTNLTDFTQTDNCHVVPAGGSCTIKVNFAPTATGPRAAVASITDNGGASPQSIALAGTGN